MQTISKKISTNAPSGQDQAAKDKRVKKINEYILGQALEDSAKELPEGLFRKILEDCGMLSSGERKYLFCQGVAEGYENIFW